MQRTMLLYSWYDKRRYKREVEQGAKTKETLKPKNRQVSLDMVWLYGLLQIMRIKNGLGGWKEFGGIHRIWRHFAISLFNICTNCGNEDGSVKLGENMCLWFFIGTIPRGLIFESFFISRICPNVKQWNRRKSLQEANNSKFTLFNKTTFDSHHLKLSVYPYHVTWHL